MNQNQKQKKMNKRIAKMYLSKILSTLILITLSGMTFAVTDSLEIIFGINYFLVILLCMIWE